jgi:putative addiction module component (TIGR02574 family)
MRPNEIIHEINKLDPAEKLLLVEDVWDSIAKDNSELTMAEWQKKELSTRFEEYKSGVQKLHDWKSVHEGIKNDFK